MLPSWLKTLSVVGARGGGAVVSFMLALVAANRLGPGQTGHFFVVVSLASVAAMVAQVGLGGSVLRFVGILNESGDVAGARGVHRLALRIAFFTSLVIAGGLVLVAPWLSDLFGLGDSSSLFWAAVAVVPMAAVSLYSQALIGMDRQAAGATVLNIAPPALATAALLVSGVRGWVDAVRIWALAYVTVGVCVALLWHRLGRGIGSSGQSGRPSAAISASVLLRSAGPLLVVSLGSLAIAWTDTLMLGAMSPASDVGIYSVARQIAAAVSLVVLAMGGLMAPRFARLHSQGDRPGLVTASRRAARTCTLLALPATLLILAVPGPILSVFGADFVQADTVLRILVVGQLLNAAAGPVGFLLIMMGDEKAHARSLVAAAAANVVLNLAFIPAFGAKGAALATALSTVIFNALALRSARGSLRAWTVGAIETDAPVRSRSAPALRRARS
jgi:O-antigen/teichoic acid export membrane protein